MSTYLRAALLSETAMVWVGLVAFFVPVPLSDAVKFKEQPKWRINRYPPTHHRAFPRKDKRKF